MNGFSSIRSKHNDGKEGRWRWRCKEYRTSMKMEVIGRFTDHQWRRRRRKVPIEGVEVVRAKLLLDGTCVTSYCFNSFIRSSMGVDQ